MIMIVPPMTMVRRRPRRSPSHRFASAPIRQPISCADQGDQRTWVRPEKQTTHVNRYNETLQCSVIRLCAVSGDYRLRERLLELQTSVRHDKDKSLARSCAYLVRR